MTIIARNGRTPDTYYDDTDELLFQNLLVDLLFSPPILCRLPIIITSFISWSLTTINYLFFPIFFPQLGQKVAPAGTSALQAGHSLDFAGAAGLTAMAPPHSEQNLEVDGT